MSLVSRYDFQKCVDRYKGDWHAKTLTCIDQFKIMSFAQFTDRSSLRDIEMTLEFCGKGLYHAGLRTVPKSTKDQYQQQTITIYNMLDKKILQQLVFTHKTFIVCTLFGLSTLQSCSDKQLSLLPIKSVEF